jgi:uncharacterized protein (TIGR02271 family)
MAMQADELMGTQVTGSDGQPVGFVDEVFRDDMDGEPSWVRVRSGGQEHLVPLSGSAMTTAGLSVPFDARKIAEEPALDVDRYMSAAQADELRGYFGLTPGGQEQADGQRSPADWALSQAGEAQRDPTQASAAPWGGARHRREPWGGARHRREPWGEARASQAGPTASQMIAEGHYDAAGQGWLILTEERVQVGTEVVECGRVRLRRYVDTEPIERVVHVFHEEYEVEHIPILPGEPVGGALADGDQELVLHEERAVFTKEAVPVERVRLAARRVEEDRMFRGEVRKERIEIETEAPADRTPRG